MEKEKQREAERKCERGIKASNWSSSGATETQHQRLHCWGAEKICVCVCVWVCVFVCLCVLLCYRNSIKADKYTAPATALVFTGEEHDKSLSLSNALIATQYLVL